MDLHPDFKDFLAVLVSEDVEYLVIGGYAVGFHARPRFTKDLDIWVRDTEDNLRRLHAALVRFGAPDAVTAGVLTGDSDDILWMGAPPTRIDILREIEGVTFGDAYERRVRVEWAGVPVSILGLQDLLVAKRAAGREQDLLDVRALEQASGIP
jgi:hypothetical protein